jgi:hypothetical protein
LTHPFAASAGGLFCVSAFLLEVSIVTWLRRVPLDNLVRSFLPLNFCFGRDVAAPQLAAHVADL